jgi:hypothetical protein
MSSYRFFDKETSTDHSYLLLRVFHNSTEHVGVYNKGSDGEYITDIISGERFYTLRAFVLSVQGLSFANEWTACSFYNDGTWNSLVELV